MNYIIIGAVIVVIILFIIYGNYLKSKYLKLTERDFTEYEQEKQKLETDYARRKSELDTNYQQQLDYHSSQISLLRAERQKEIESKQSELNYYDRQLESRKQDLQREVDSQAQQSENLQRIYESKLEDYKAHRIALVDEQLQHCKSQAIARLQNDLRAAQEETRINKEKMTQAITEYGNEIITSINDDIISLCAQKESLESEVADFKEKQRIINEAILRKREVEEQSQFYKIQLSHGAKEDIQLLMSIMPRLHDTTSLYKLIYDLYIARPVKEMEKRVLNNESFSGIYKITGPDERIYIGKSTDIKSRWQQHCKSAFHTGTISWAAIHDAMEKQGIDNFTFEVIERVEKENLSSREKFWIEFYGADRYGFNMKAGG